MLEFDIGGLRTLSKLFEDKGLSPIFIGNGAAQLQGARVNTLDWDFVVPDSDENYLKLEEIAEALGTELEDNGSHLSIHIPQNAVHMDFLQKLPAGASSYEELYNQSREVNIGGSAKLRTASLEFILKSKIAANRSKDHKSIPAITSAIEEWKARFKSPEQKDHGIGR